VEFLHRFCFSFHVGCSSSLPAVCLSSLQIFPGSLSPLSDHISTSDPANNPLSVAAFLEGGHDAALIQQWENAVDSPLAQRLDQQVVTQTRSQAARSHQRSEDAGPSFLEQQWVQEGQQASTYEPTDWPAQPITPDPYQHLAQTQGGVPGKEHNNIEGGLGVQSASIPWDYRHYTGNLNSHRKAEPLVYTPLVLAKDAEGTSAIDLTSLANRKYQSERMSSNPQYANTLSALTEYVPVQLHPTDHWLPQIPAARAPGVRNKKYWENHFLDLYAPTPPPLLAPVVPRMKKKAAQVRRDLAMMEQDAKITAAMPEFLRKAGNSVQSMVAPVLSQQTGHQVRLRDLAGEDSRVAHSRDMDALAPAHASEADIPLAFLEEDVHAEWEEPKALWDLEVQEMDFPQARDEITGW
jgi:hypothetical protein